MKLDPSRELTQIEKFAGDADQGKEMALQEGMTSLNVVKSISWVTASLFQKSSICSTKKTLFMKKGIPTLGIGSSRYGLLDT